MSSPPSQLPPAYSSWRVWGGYIALLVVAVPWYWRLLPATFSQQIAGGLPLWALVVVLGSVGMSIYTAALLLAPWPEEQEAELNSRTATPVAPEAESADEQSPRPYEGSSK
ncbi:hypothetical protein [Lignipirellula cremea]|uniref:Uncharacterized protein n=1 Tax=Lignipirellula cremea TaxID=2528010 RepID=A0A518DRI4_9BACT|nr:hypothetical protein [Lignipirellula cremea]QDU94446.1 hypothetical protein Pla8534_22370 [Lignipirellula cremea]